MPLVEVGGLSMGGANATIIFASVYLTEKGSLLPRWYSNKDKANHIAEREVTFNTEFLLQRNTDQEKRDRSSKMYIYTSSGSVATRQPNKKKAKPESKSNKLAIPKNQKGRVLSEKDQAMAEATIDRFRGTTKYWPDIQMELLRQPTGDAAIMSRCGGCTLCPFRRIQHYKHYHDCQVHCCIHSSIN